MATDLYEHLNPADPADPFAVIIATRSDTTEDCSMRNNLGADLELPGINVKRLFRAFVSPAEGYGPEITAFIEAGTRDAAVKKIAACVATLEYRKPEDVAERIYNCNSWPDLVADGVSDDLAMRLFETGWSGGKATHFVPQPLFLLAQPAELIRIWATIPQDEDR